MERTYDVNTRPELNDRWAKLTADERAYTVVSNRAENENIRADARTKLDELQAEREGLEEEIAAAARTITVTRVAPKVWGRIVAENPPRDGDPYDARMGINTDTFDRAIMPHAITSVTDGLGESVEWDWPALAEAMSPGQYEQVIGDVLRMHMERDAVPFSLADWRSRRSSEPSSK